MIIAQSYLNKKKYIYIFKKIKKRCSKEYQLKENKCVNESSEGYFKDQGTNEIKKCHLTCKRCEGENENECKECYSGSFLIE